MLRAERCPDQQFCIMDTNCSGFAVELIFFIHAINLKTHTHTPICRGLVLESAIKSADSNAKLADSSTNFVIVGRPPILNIFNILLSIQLANANWPPIADGRWQISLLGMDLVDNVQSSLIHK